MVSIKDVEFWYPGAEFVIRVPDLNWKAPSSVALIGPSGSGKTTLLKLLSGELLAQGGRVRFGEDKTAYEMSVPRRRLHSRTIGLISQELELLEYLNVLDNILLQRHVTPARVDSEIRQRATSVARSLGIGGLLKQRIDRLSQGEKQRVAIARALLEKPPLILADEPTGHLDPASTDQVLGLMLKTCRENNSLLVMTTHDWRLLDRFEHVVEFQLEDGFSIACERSRVTQ